MAESKQADEKVQSILTGLSEGKNRDEVARDNGYKNFRSMDGYMRRRNFLWRNDGYIPAVDEVDKQQGKIPVPEKTRLILRKIEEGFPLDTLASMMGFCDKRDLASYMAAHSYVWSHDTGNFILHGTDNDIEESPGETEPETDTGSLPDRYESILSFLESNQEVLEKMVLHNIELHSIPRYIVPGITVSKSYSISTLLHDLIKDFCRDKNILQKDVIEVAVIDFLRRYGYGAQVAKTIGQKQKSP